MKRQFSSLDMHYLLEELQVLAGSKVDKIYQPEKNTFIFGFYKTNVGKKLLQIEIGKCIFLANEKEDSDTLGFGMFLRKHLEGLFLESVEQLKPERIIKIIFKVKDEEKILYIEMFSKGNLILCDKNNVILNCLEHLEFRDRTLKPKANYKFPKSEHNFFEISKKELRELLSKSKKDNVVTCLAVDLGIGGIYSEEICLNAGIQKEKNPNELEEKEVKYIFDAIGDILSKKIKPFAYFEDGELADFSPFLLDSYKKSEKKEFQNFSEAISFFFSQFREIKTTEQDKKIISLKRIIEEQEKTIEAFRNEEKELRKNGELIYQKYILIKEILDELNKASEKYSWKEIKEKLKDHKIVKDLNEKDRKIVVEIE